MYKISVYGCAIFKKRDAMFKKLVCQWVCYRNILFADNTHSFHILSHLIDSLFLRFNIYLLVGC